MFHHGPSSQEALADWFPPYAQLKHQCLEHYVQGPQSPSDQEQGSIFPLLLGLSPLWSSNSVVLSSPKGLQSMDVVALGGPPPVPKEVPPSTAPSASTACI